MRKIARRARQVEDTTTTMKIAEDEEGKSMTGIMENATMNKEDGDGSR
jgi:hypothetical protein